MIPGVASLVFVLADMGFELSRELRASGCIDSPPVVCVVCALFYSTLLHEYTAAPAGMSCCMTLRFARACLRGIQSGAISTVLSPLRSALDAVWVSAVGRAAFCFTCLVPSCMMDDRMDELGDCNSLCVHEDREVLVERSVNQTAVCYEFVRLTVSQALFLSCLLHTYFTYVYTYLHAYQRRGHDGESWT